MTEATMASTEKEWSIFHYIRPNEPIGDISHKFHGGEWQVLILVAASKHAVCQIARKR